MSPHARVLDRVRAIPETAALLAAKPTQRTLDVTLPTADERTASLARHDDASFRVRMELEVEGTPATVDGVTTIAGADRDLAFLGDGTRFEDLTILRTGAKTIERTLHFGPSIATARVRDGRVELVDASGRVGLVTEDVFAVDAHGVRRTIVPRVQPIDGGAVLAIDVPADLVAPITVDPMWTTVPSLKAARSRPTAVALPTGKVLVLGGTANDGSSVTTAELFDPGTNTWSAAGTPGAFPLPSSAAITGTKVLIVGETNVVYDITANSFSGAGGIASAGAATVTLDDGRVFVSGGDGYPTQPTRIWSPTTGFTTVANDPVPRYNAAAVKIGGKVLVIGGNTGTKPVPEATYESAVGLYDPVGNTWSTSPSLNIPRAFGAAITLGTGEVLVVGGYNGIGDIRQAEIMNPSTRAWTTIADPLGGYFTQLVSLPGDRVLTSEGTVFDTTTRKAAGTNPPLSVQYWGGAAALPGGRALIAGGGGGGVPVVGNSTIFQLGAAGDDCFDNIVCASKFCADGVCCNTACTDACSMCALPASKGTCTPLTGMLPKVFLACGRYVCGATGCKTSCGTNADCMFDSYCNAGTCVAKLDAGGTCVANGDCKSGFCTDGVCCDGACTGQCEACDIPGKAGVCSPVFGAPHGSRTACGGAGAGTDCAMRCDGTSRTTCTFPGTTAPCGTYACKDGIESHVARCNGAGACTDVSKNCGAYGCDATACRSICATAADCAAGYRCAAGACVAREGLGKACDDATTCTTGFCVDGVCCGVSSCDAGKSCALAGYEGTCMKNRGTTCTSAAECGSGQCIDGVCCDRACDGVCEACDVPGHFGTCFPVKGAPHGARGPCKSDPTAPCADEACDGSDVSKCAGFAGPEVSCRVSSCSAGRAVAPATCDGKGACPAPVEVSCGGYACDGATSACRTTCRNGKDCLDGFDCVHGLCAPKAARCSTDRLSVVQVDGSTQSCAPFVCKGGRCLGECTTSNDCIAGRICDATGKTCVEPPAAEASSDGGCSTGRGAPRGAPWLLFSLVLGAVVGRRTRVGSLLFALLAGCSSRDESASADAGIGHREGDLVARVRALGFSPQVHGARAISVHQAAEKTTLDDGEAILAITTPDLAPKAPHEVDGARVFVDAAKDVDVVHLVGPDRFEDVRVLRSAAASPVAHYTLDTTLAARMNGRTLELVDDKGRVHFVAEPPYAIDAKGVRRDAEVAFAERTLTVTLDTTGLSYPITLDPTWSTVAPMSAARFAARGGATGDGRVIVAAGRATSGLFVSTIELYDPSLNTWKTLPTPPTGILNAVFVTLPGARVAELDSNQIYDATSNTWTAMGAPPLYRDNPVGVALADGRILVTGGKDSVGNPISSALIYDTGTKIWTNAGSTTRPSFKLIRLAGGDVLSFGDTASDRFSITSKSWSTIASPPTGFNVFAPLPDGRLLGAAVGTNSTAFWDPATNAWSTGPACPIMSFQMMPLSDGTVFMRGFNGTEQIATYDVTHGWLPAGPWLPSAVSEYVAQPAFGARLVIAGGKTTSAAVADTWVWKRMPNGQACTGAGECESAQCVDGYCCESACTGGCQSCNQVGKVGLCSPVTGSPVGGRTGCSPYLTCSAGTCASSCSTDAQCISTHWCDGTSKCVAKETNGKACTTDRGCLSGNCVDGVCCDSRCGDQCAACDVPGKVGTCSPVTGAPHAPRAACGGFGAGTTCGIRCDGVTTATCTYPTASTACGAAGCSAGVETHTATCNGLGLCADTPKSCGAYGCGTTTCKTTCSGSGDCAKGFYCKDNACVPASNLGKPCTSGESCGTGFCVEGVCCASSSCGAGSSCATPGKKGTCAKIDGTTCASDLECGSGACVDGICCESRCAGQCQACDVPGQVGRCAPVTGAPHGARPVCPKDDSNPCKGSSCDGKDTSKCVALAGPEIRCREPSCDKGIAVTVGNCNGTGTCPAMVTSSCEGFACDPATKGCRTTCATGSDCEGGYICRDNKCIPATATCSADELSVVSVDGTSASCAPYLCREGACLTSCASSADCVAGTLCDPSAKTCVTSAPPVAEDAGGCAFGARSSGTAGLWLAAISLLVRRRRQATRR